jgi:hypothetical protein
MEMLGYNLDKHTDLTYVLRVLDKLDETAADLWEHTLKDKKVPELKKLLEFLECHATALERKIKPTSEKKATAYYTDAPQQANKHYKDKKKHQEKSVQKSSVENREIQQQCKLGCNHSHPVFKCRKFLGSGLDERWTLVKQNKLCFKCLRTFDGKCQCTYVCAACKKPHNNLLHRHESSRNSNAYYTDGQSSQMD